MSSLVGDVMTRNVVSVRERAQYTDIVLIMCKCGFSACPVLDASDAVVGVVSEDDLLVREADASPRASGKLARRLHAKHLKRMPEVTADGSLVGIVSRVDLLGVYDRPDSEIEAEIRKRVIVDEFVLDGLAFNVAALSGVVTISGSVDHRAVALNLLDAIRKVHGVVAVRDRLSYPQH